MAEQTLIEPQALESSEIKTYVVRPSGPRDYRKRFSNGKRGLPGAELARRMQAWWLSRRPVEVRHVAPAAGPEPVVATASAVRYDATLAPAGSPSKLKPALWTLGALVVAGLAATLVLNQPARPAASAKTSVLVTPSVAVPVSTERVTPASVAPAAPAIQTKRTANVTYTVETGDSFTSVAAKYGVTPRTVRLVNELPLGYRLKKGEKLVIPPSNGAYHRVSSGETIGVLAKRYGVSEALVAKHNPSVNPLNLQVGSRLFIPGATALLTSPEAGKGTRDYRKGGAFANRLSASRSLIGQFGARVGDLAWPASGQFSSGFGVRGGSFHPGLDICAPVGTPVKAAREGVVISAGWAGAYGYAVDIDHGGGVVTRYGHCSKLLVSAGQQVGAGEVIAKMGSTGRSTGPHVHFEVRIQGRAVNPATFF